MTRVFRSLVALSLLVSCGGDPTQIIVEIYGADEILAEVTGVRVRVEGRGPSDDFADPPVYVTDTAIPASASDFPLTHVIAPLNGDAQRQFRVTAQGLVSGAAGVTVISEARAWSGFVAGETRVLRLYLPGGTCRDRTCPVTQTCVQGSCEDLDFIPPELLPRRSDAFDAGLDAGDDADMDAGACPGQGDPCQPESLCEQGIIECSTDGEPVCVGTGSPLDAGSVCRDADGVCDAEEVCDGTSLECPVDASLPDLTACGESLICVGGECGECVANDPCDTGNACERGQLVCEGTPACTSAGPADDGTVCRAATGLCDEPETCDGTSVDCPDDALFPAGHECRSAEGPCDLPDVCDGTSPTCTNALAPATTECNPSQGACDPAEMCDGISVECPSDAIHPAGMLCRAAAGECDISEQCNGTDPKCPDDAFVGFGTLCSTGVCNGAGMCADLGCGDPCTTGNPCETGIIDCSGAAPTCIRNEFLPAGTTCRAAAGPCDVAETCTGSSATCPSDAFASNSTVCRAAAGTCDVAELCNGTGAACPADARRPASFTCRVSVDVCDLAETCDGMSVNCPSDAFQPDSFVCRVSGGLCDIQETCPGTSARCPVDAVRPSGEVCRISAGMCDVEDRCDGSSKSCPNVYVSGDFACRESEGICDVAELCTGSSPACPNDAFVPAGTVCRLATGTNCDAPEVCSGSGAFCPGTSIAGCGDLVISEVLPDDAMSLSRVEGFVELYNTADEPVDVDACLITNSFGAQVNLDLASNTILAPGGFFLVAYDSMGGGLPDIVSSRAHPTNVQGEVLLMCNGSVVDACGWGMAGLDGGATEDAGVGDGGTMMDGGAGSFWEGPPVMTPMGGRSLERKACGTSTVTLMTTGAHSNAGNSEDTNRNVNDFIIRPTPLPQSTSSSPETPLICTG